MNIWHDIAADRISKDVFVSVVEISKGSKNKYELDKDTGMLKLDRILFTSTHYPANYGFIPLTYAEDNDPLDVLILSSESITPMTLVESRPIGVLKMIDSGDVDEKIIAVCTDDPFYDSYNDVGDLPAHIFEEISHFYAVYKMLEHKETVVKEVLGSQEAKRSIERSIKAYQEKFGR